MIESGIGGMKGQRKKGWEPAGIVLQATQAKHVVYPVLVILHVPVKHGRIGAQAQFVRRASGLNPLIAIDLVVADDMPYTVGEDLSTAPRQGIHTCVFHPGERFGNGEFGATRQVGHFDHGEGFDVHLGKALLKARDQIKEILKGKIGMQTADDVELRHRLAVAGGCGLPGLFESHGVGAFGALLAAKGAKPACGYANIGRVDMPVDIEVSKVAVHALAYVVGQPAHCQNVLRTVERDALVEIETLARQNLFGNRPQAHIVCLKTVALGYERHKATPLLMILDAPQWSRSFNWITICETVIWWPATPTECDC